MDDTGQIGQHKAMAMGDGPMKGGDFGCSSLNSMRGKEMDGPKGKMLDQEGRGAGSPVKHTKGKMPAQAMPDHGRHY